jgi:hypothetical protein
MSVLTALVWMLPAASVDSGEAIAASDVVYSPQRAFRIPLDVAPEERARLSGVRLYVSEDQGRTWVRHSDGSPEASVITFRAKRDGEFWFGITLVDKSGAQTPADVRAAGPGLKVVVDTTKPSLDVRAIRSKSGRRGVRWTVSDAAPRSDSIRMAVWDERKGSWKPLEIRHPETGMAWFEEDQDVRKVQAAVLDQAGNEAVVEVEVNGDQFVRRELESFVLDARPAGMVVSAKGPTSPAEPAESGVQPVGHVVDDASGRRGETTVCGSKQIVVNYAADDGEAPSGRVELWATRNDGRTWSLVGVDGDGKSPIEGTLAEEGPWGLRIVMTDSNLPSPGPPVGSVPEMYIEVDATPPSVELLDVAATGNAVGVRWRVHDRNPAEAPVDVYASSSPVGPWHAVARGLKPSGEHVFTPPAELARGDLYVRVEAHDRAKHVGSAVTPAPIRLGGR